mgnify:CR=1 FL=1
MLPLLGGAMLAGGLAGSLFGNKKSSKKAYKNAMAQMSQVSDLINQQYQNVDTYFNQANQDFGTQYQDYYSTQMQDAVNSLAGTGIYESPVSEMSLGRTRKALAQTYATGRSELAGQKMQALGSIDQQKINYLQNLAQLQYGKAMQSQQSQSQMFGMIGGLGTSLMGL